MEIIIVNASKLLSMQQVMDMIPGLQDDMDHAFLPAWKGYGPPDTVGISAIDFAAFHADESRYMDDDTFPIFLNRHSADPGALGWHTAEGHKIFGRVFVGDCMHYGISVSTDLSHEIHETVVDPSAQRVFKLADGRLAALETDDAVEADAQARSVRGTMVSNFVHPIYFSDRHGAGNQYDQQGYLRGPCPALTPGGYLSLFTPGKGWGQVQEDRADGRLGRRAVMPVGWRRAMRKETDETLFNEFQF